jgi:hypothetical protein
MFFDNIILFLNVLEQFAIRVTIFDLNIEDIIKYVNKTFFFNVDDVNYFNNSLLKNITNVNDPYLVLKDSYSLLDHKIGNSCIIFNKLEYQSISFKFTYA